MKFILLGVLVASYALASSIDYQDEQLDHDYYCSMVKEGVWPNYRDEVCE